MAGLVSTAKKGFSIMDASVAKPRGWLMVTAAVLVAAAIFGWIAVDRSRRAAEWHAQVERLSQRIEKLEADLRELENRPPTFHDEARAQSKPPVDSVDPELANRLFQLSTAQSNTAILLERLMARTKEQEPPTAKDLSATLISLEAMLPEQEQKRTALNRQISELMVKLRIPADVLTMPRDQVFADAQLQTYWPYFEALRERETQEFILERLRVRIMQTKIELGVEKAKGRGL